MRLPKPSPVGFKVVEPPKPRVIGKVAVTRTDGMYFQIHCGTFSSKQAGASGTVGCSGRYLVVDIDGTSEAYVVDVQDIVKLVLLARAKPKKVRKPRKVRK